MIFKLHGKQLLQSDECYTDVTALLIGLQQHYITDAPTCTPVHHMLDYTYNLFLCLSLSPLLSHTQTHTHNWTEGEYFEQVI